MLLTGQWSCSEDSAAPLDQQVLDNGNAKEGYDEEPVLRDLAENISPGRFDFSAVDKIDKVHVDEHVE